MTTRCSKQELGLVTFALVMGMWLRFAHSDRLAVEHFDEGVYASGLWYDEIFDGAYPMRHLYAPPLLPTLISVVSVIPGCEEMAPFLPSILLGSLTLLVVWWMSRTLFGQSAGLFTAFIASFSDMHALFSRMALTDAPVLFFICLSVAVGVIGVSRTSIRLMILGGLVCGLAWWTKYTGWLPIAIIASGTGFWWLASKLKKRPTIGAVQLMKLNAAFAVTALVVWLPWLWMLQSEGGYAAVKANHGGYWKGLDGWQDRLANHLTYYLSLEGWFGAAAIGIGILAAGTRRWIELRRFTWNEDGTKKTSGSPNEFPSIELLKRSAIASLSLFVVATAIGPLALLMCLSIGGLLGRFLWPVTVELYDRSIRGDASPPIAGGASYSPVDFRVASSVDPMLGASVVLAWFAGMLLTTPMYSPFPRLSLPLLASVWLAAGAGIAWWIEGVLNVDRRGGRFVATWTSRILRRITMVLVGFAVGLAWLQGWQLNPSRVWSSRTSLRDAAWEVAETVVADANGTLDLPIPELPLDEDGMIIPYPDTGEQGTDGDIPTVWDQVAEPRNSFSPLADLATPELIVYVIGEPALLKHLNDAGVLAAPVQDFNVKPFQWEGRELPTYLILGPNALRQEGIFDQWIATIAAFDHVTDIRFTVSDIVLYNLFSPRWIAQQPESRVQTFELYRVRGSLP